jgi:hypothetical protein
MNWFKTTITYKVRALALAAFAFFAAPAFGQGALPLIGVVAANTSSNLLSAPAIVRSMVWYNTNATANLVKLYDSSSTSTNYSRLTNNVLTSYTTNWNSIFTNANGIVITNSFTGLYTALVPVAAATVERPKVTQFIVPALGSLTLTDQNLSFGRGVTAVPTTTGTYVITYDNP